MEKLGAIKICFKGNNNVTKTLATDFYQCNSDKYTNELNIVLKNSRQLSDFIDELYDTCEEFMYESNIIVTYTKNSYMNFKLQDAIVINFSRYNSNHSELSLWIDDCKQFKIK